MKPLVARIPYFLKKSNEFFGYPRSEVQPHKYKYRYERLITYKTIMNKRIKEQN